ncbi:MAG: insulinase family protein [Betaproteobacteria bacterium]|nr:insulinase family protein [Betaproteobacteria bacterium]
MHILHARLPFSAVRLRLVLVLTLLVAGLHPGPSGSAEPWRPMHQVEGVESLLLPNGLEVLLYPSTTKASTTVNLTVKVGSRHEGYGETGMAHLLEHMVFKGSPKFPNGLSEFATRGFRVNGTTSWDRTNYYASFAQSNDNTAWMIRWLGDILVNAYVRKSDLDSEMTVVRNEFERGENNPAGVLFQQVFASAYTWHNYGKAIIGARSDIENVSIDRLQAFYRHHYQPDNAVLVVAGVYDRAKVLGWIEEAFGVIPRPTRQLEPTYTVEPVQEGPREVRLRRIGDAPIVILSYHGPSALHPHFPALSLASHMIGGPNNRIDERIVRKGVAAGGWAWARSAPEPANALFSLQLKSDQSIADAARALIALVETAGSEGFTAAELEAAKAYFANQHAQMLADPERVALALSESIALGDWRMLMHQRDRIAAVSLAEVNRVAGSFWVESNRTLGLFEPQTAPRRAPAERQVGIAEAMKGFVARAPEDQGELFEASAGNIRARVSSLRVDDSLTLQTLRKRNAANLVVLQASLRYGSLASLQGEAEAGQLAVAMLSRGTKNLSRRQFAERMTALRAVWGIQGGAEGLSLSLRVAAERFDEALGLLEQALLAPAMEEAELRELKTALIASLESSRQDPQALASRRIARVFADYPPSDPRHVAELDESMRRIQALSLAQVQAFWDRFIRPGPAVFTVIGDLDAPQLAARLGSFWSRWKSERPTQVVYERIARDAAPVPPLRDNIVTPDKPNAVWLARCRFPLSDDRREYRALQLGMRMLAGNGSSSGRLWDRVREKEGLSYGVGGSLSGGDRDEAASLGFYAIFAAPNRERLIAIVREEFDRALREGFTQEELDRARKGLEAQLQLQWAQEMALAGTLNWLHEQSRDAGFLEQMRDLRASITLEDVQAALRRYLNPESLSVILAGDFR